MRISPDTEIQLDEVAKIIFAGASSSRDVDKEQLAIGIAVELEHTDDIKWAEKITCDHLAENPTYYTDPMKKNWGLDEAKERADNLAKEASKWNDTSAGTTDEGNAVGNWTGGWLKGEWKCPQCGTMIGKNLRGAQPFALAREHQEKCGIVQSTSYIDSILTKSANSPEPVKTWQQIRDEEDPDGKKHDLRLKCSQCDNTSTCRCSTPKRKFIGLCDKCAKEIPSKVISASVFVLEDDPERISIFKSAFGPSNVVTTKNAADALNILRTRKFAKVFLDRDLSSSTETGEDVAWQMEKERLCITTPVVIHSENTRGQKVMARYLNRYHSNVTVIPFRALKKSLQIVGGIKLAKVVTTDGYADGGEPYTDEEMDLMEGVNQPETNPDDKVSRTRFVKVTFDNGEIVSTSINGTKSEIRSYYLDQEFTTRDEQPQKAITIEFMD